MAYCKVGFLSTVQLLTPARVESCLSLSASSAYHISFIHLPVSSHVCCFCPLTIANNAARNMSVQIRIPVLAFPSFGYEVRVELLDHMEILCLILEKLHTVSGLLFKSGIEQ